MLSAGFVLPARATALPTPSAVVAQWSMLELSFTSQTSYSNAYLGAIDLTVTFSGPAGVQKVVPGFWDGGSRFKVRFAPPAQGSWTYRTRSSLDASLSNLAGSFSVGVPLPGNHGFVRVNTANPYTFVWDERQNGAPLGFFMLGQTYYEIVRNAAGQGGWRQAIDQSAAYGIDKIRLLIYPWPGDAASNAYPDTQPFSGSSAQPNHDQLNLGHWQLLDTIIRYLESKQMVADVILFADADRIYGTPAQNNRYVRYTLARLSAYHNVIWTMSNEWNYADPDKDGQPGTAHDKILFSAWGALVAATDPYFTLRSLNDRPISRHCVAA